MPELKLYTIADLREWLMHNHAAEGLSEQVIAPSRAWGIIHNPYVKDDDPVVAAIFVADEMAAFTAAFPESINGQRYWWFTSLWCNPKHQGKGYGLIVIGSLAEVYGVENILDRWGAQETVEIFSCLGAKTIYTPRYIFGSKINCHTPKGKLLHVVRELQKGLHHFVESPAKREDYSLRYLSYIDDDTYAFIQSRGTADMFPRTQPILNWILKYSFTQSCPLIEHTPPTTPFAPAKAQSNHIYAVQVLDNTQLVGVYLMKHTEGDLHLLYLYYDVDKKYIVFASIRDHINRLGIDQFVTDNKELSIYVQHNIYFPKHKTVQIHFSHPNSFVIPDGKTLQYGDGDGFAVE